MPRPEASSTEQQQSRIEIAGIAHRGIDVFDASMIELIPEFNRITAKQWFQAQDVQESGPPLARTKHSPDITCLVGSNALTVVRKNLVYPFRRSPGSRVTEERKIIVNRLGETATPLHIVTRYAINQDGSFARYFNGVIDVGENGLPPQEAVMRIPQIVASLRN